MQSASTIMHRVKMLFIPPVKMDVSEWAEKELTIPKGMNKGQKYNPDHMPYQNEIMNCVNDPNIERICISAAARIGKTFILQAIMGYFMAHDPKSMMYMRPSDDDIKKFSKEELTSLIENTATLKKSVDSSTKTYDHKMYSGVSMRLIGSNSPGKLKGWEAFIALIDELDTMYAIPGYGYPAELAEERTAEYTEYGRKLIYISTPTVMNEENKIDWLYEKKSDRRVYKVKCPYCQHEQELYFRPREDQLPNGQTILKGGVRFEHCRKDLNDVYYECENQECKGSISDSQRITIMRKGRWVATQPENKRFAGFKISRLYSPEYTLESLVRDFLNKKDNVLMLRQFLNDVLAEAWDENREQKASSNELFQRREHYISPVPFGVGFLTMAVDVQGNSDTEKCWLEYEIKGWGKDNENWSIEHGVILGPATDKNVWDKVLTISNKTFLTWNGDSMPITVVGIDTQGGFTKEVTQFIKGKSPKIIGLDGKKNKPGTPLMTKRRNRKINSWEVGTDTAKDTIFAILSVKLPGANCCHFPDTLDEEYFLSLLSEKKIPQIVGGVKVKKYKQTRDRNEVLDLFVYNWYLYNHINRIRPSLLADSLKSLESPELPEEVEETGEATEAMQPALVSILPAPATPVPALSARERYLAKMRGFSEGGSGSVDPYWNPNLSL